MTPDECVKCLMTGKQEHISMFRMTSLAELPTTFRFLGLQQGYFQITNDFITDILRVASRGNAPWNNVFWDSCLTVIAAVRTHRPRHLRYMLILRSVL